MPSWHPKFSYGDIKIWYFCTLYFILLNKVFYTLSNNGSFIVFYFKLNCPHVRTNNPQIARWNKKNKKINPKQKLRSRWVGDLTDTQKEGSAE